MSKGIQIEKIRFNLPFATFIAIAGFIVTTTAVFVTFREDYEHRMKTVEARVEKNSEDIAAQARKNIDLEITLAKVERDTSWMRAMMEKIYGFENSELED